jgi:uncharacterized protein YraI
MLKRILLPIVVLVALAVVALAPLTTIEAQSGFGTGWTATYHNCPALAATNPDLNTCTVLTSQPVAAVNFSYGTGSPIPGVNIDNFYIRFDSVQNLQPGNYEFIAASDDGIRVTVNGQVIINQLIGRVFTTDRATIAIPGGATTIRVDYIELIDQAQVQFQWLLSSSTGPTLPPGVIPTVGPTLPATAIPPTALPPIPPGALTATVIQASVLNVRAAPYIGAPRVGRILRGQTYAVVGRDDRARWFLLQLSGQQAWAWGFYLFVNGNEFNAPVVNDFTIAGNPAAGAEVTVQTQAGLRLRAAPNVLSPQIGRIPWGDLLPVIGRTAGNDWYQVVFRGTIGWIASSYVEILEGDLSQVPVTG